MLRFSTFTLSGSNPLNLRSFLVPAVFVFVTFVTGCGLSEREAAQALYRSDAGRAKEVFIDLGFLSSRCGQSPRTGKYAVLRRAGVIRVAVVGQSKQAFTTREGDKIFKEVGAKPIALDHLVPVSGQVRCNVRTWAVPIAVRELSSVKITDADNNTYDVVYTWRWKPNAVGEAFQFDGPIYKRLSIREQESLNDGELPLDNRYPHVTRLNVRRIAGVWQAVD